MPFNNDLTRLLDIKSPIVLGPMANASGGELAAATSLGGGFGFLGAGYWDADTVRSHFQTARAMLEQGGLTSTKKKNARLPIGIGFLVWRLSKVHGSPVSSDSLTLDAEGISSPAIEIVEAALRARPKSIWLSFGEPDDLVAWADFIRKRDSQLSAELSANGDGGEAQDPLVIMVGIGTEQQARHAVESVGCDVLSVTGQESGGHGMAASPTLFTLLPRVAHILPTLKPRPNVSTILERPLLIGAGGLSSGASLAALIALGAQGAVFGTRYLLTPEAMYTSGQKDLLKNLGSATSSSSTQGGKDEPAGDHLTLRSMAFDDARGTLDWPAGVDGRGIRNQTVIEYEKDPSDASQSNRQKRYQQAAEEKDVNRLITWAGTGVGVMEDIVPAKELTERLTKEAEEALQRARGQVV